MAGEQKNLPLVTIGIPTYNGGARIMRSLSSCWNQQYPNIQILVSDNCSTDNSAQIIAEICQDHPEVTFIQQPSNLGQTGNYDFLLQNAKGKYFIWLADDDQLEPGIIEKSVSFLEANEEYTMAGGQVKYWKDGKPDIVEGGFTLAQDSPSRRVFSFYARVIFGGVVHTVQRRELTRRATIRKIIGNDFQFIGNVAFMGKIKQFDFIGYHKNFGGLSASPRRYAKALNDSWFAGEFPQIKIAFDASREVMYRSPVFDKLNFFNRLGLAIAVFWARIYCYYFKLLVVSRIQRWIINPLLGRRAVGT